MELNFMASHGYPPGLILPQHQIFTPSKEFQQLRPSFRSREDMLNSCSLCNGSYQVEDDWKPMTQQFKGVQFIDIDKAIKKHVLNRVKADTHPNSILLSLGIARQIARHENIIKFLTSDSSEIERAGLDISVLSELMELQGLRTDMHQESFLLEHQFCSHDVAQPSLMYPVSENCFEKPLLGMERNMFHESEITCEADRRLSFINNAAGLQAILPNISEFSSAKLSTKWERHSLIVPYFERKKSRTAKAGASGSSLNLETMAPLKSPNKKAKAKQSTKKKSSKKTEKETDNKSFVRACESLLSIMIDKKRKENPAIQSLKKSGSELPQVLSQFSAVIAGTGIAVLFGVITKVACSSAPFCASKMLSTGFGVGLIWLSSAVNRLRDTIICISKRSSKADHKEEDMVKLLDDSIKEIYFRAATLLAIVVLKIA